MSTETEGYGGYTVRPKGPGSARHWLDPLPENWQRAIARAEAALAEPYRGVTTDGQVRDGGVGHRLREHDCRRGQPGEDVGRQGGAFVPAQPAEQRRCPATRGAGRGRIAPDG